MPVLLPLLSALVWTTSCKMPTLEVDDVFDTGVASSDPGDDTSQPSGLDDTGSTGGDDTGAGGGDDTGDTGEVVADPEPDYSVWIGERTFTIDGCTETTSETGYLLDEDWEYAQYLPDVEAACPACTHVYAITSVPDTLCGEAITAEDYRGVVLDSTGITEVYRLESFFVTKDYYWIWAEVLDEAADFDGWSIDYFYEGDGGWFGSDWEMEGRVDFPAK